MGKKRGRGEVGREIVEMEEEQTGETHDAVSYRTKTARTSKNNRKRDAVIVGDDSSKRAVKPPDKVAYGGKHHTPSRRLKMTPRREG